MFAKFSILCPKTSLLQFFYFWLSLPLEIFCVLKTKCVKPLINSIDSIGCFQPSPRFPIPCNARSCILHWTHSMTFWRICWVLAFLLALGPGLITVAMEGYCRKRSTFRLQLKLSQKSYPSWKWWWLNILLILWNLVSLKWIHLQRLHPFPISCNKLIIVRWQ